MKLVIIYGPPGVGKLAVAKELAKLTGFKLFHNHLTVEPVKAIFEFGHPDFWKLLLKIRLSILEFAAKNNIDCIFTVVYAAEIDDRSTEQKIRAIEKHSGKVCLVKLTCDRKELYKRIRHPSRREFSKINNVARLKEIMARHDLDAVMKFKNTLVIDNTKISPRKSAEKIIRHYKLPKPPGP
ncbi:MAG: AAA family ATPase [Candidatus Liptonbacteria bacterium]